MTHRNVNTEDASRWSLIQLGVAMQDAFSDYSIRLHLNPGAFDLMMKQRGLDPAAAGVTMAGGQIVAIWLSPVRAGRVYLFSSGTIPAFRSRGISRALARNCIAGLCRSSVRVCQTEVPHDTDVAAGSVPA